MRTVCCTDKPPARLQIIQQRKLEHLPGQLQRGLESGLLSGEIGNGAGQMNIDSLESSAPILDRSFLRKFCLQRIERLLSGTTSAWAKLTCLAESSIKLTARLMPC